MTKKTWVVLLVGILSFVLVSCGGTNENTADTNHDKENGQQTEEQQKIEQTDADDFSLGTTDKELGVASFKIPSNWGEKAGEGNITYYYPTGNGADAMIMVSLDEESTDSILNESALNSFEDGYSSALDTVDKMGHSIKETPSTHTQYAEVYCEGTLNGNNYKMTVALFNTNKGLFCVVYGQNPDYEINYKNDFDKIIDSIEISQDEGDVGDYYIKLGDCIFGKDYDGNRIAVLHYDYTNNSDKTNSAIWSVTINAYQDGIELDSLVLTFDDSVYDAGIEQTDIKPGYTMEDCQKAFKLRSDSPIEIEVKPFVGDPVLFKTVNVQ